MFNSEVRQYVEKYILKNGEQLESIISYSNDPSSLIDVMIVKKTTRTFRKVGFLTLSNDVINNYELPDKSLCKWSTGKKVQLVDHDPTTFDWLEKGWIMKETRFKKDGRTIDSMNYRMGYRLFIYQQQQAQQAMDQLIQEFGTYQHDAREVLKTIKLLLTERNERLQSLIKRVIQICNWDAEKLEVSDYFPHSWSMKMRIKFLYFSLAFIHLSINKECFDWKEIGAYFYQRIGGSKAFDSNKEEFISQLEEWVEGPVALLGLVSLGKITPLFFSGELTGRFSSYSWGPVHALTDLSISQEKYTTSATTLWLVENRAVLTRFAVEEGFLGNTKSLVACVDGHLRSSHRKFIHQLLELSFIRQVLIWSDYDQNGLLIAEQIYQADS